jgi:ribonuclease T1
MIGARRLDDRSAVEHALVRGITAVCLSLLLSVVAAAAGAAVDSCVEVVEQLNVQLRPRIDAAEVVGILRTLDRTGNRLPSKFVTKRQAREAGWRPGEDLWSRPALLGKSLGGDVFRNREKRLPDGGRVWREADLDYRGGRRGPKRLVYSNDGLMAVTVDHYRSFREVPPCQ